ncbi:MAG TPA: zinc ribbon domain-containing protein [Kiritimatiellia bacterium]|nr:zinc ribbon domain-containing protein [Kiritimatiellia bacterium]HRZ12668.1 zinc ribbon domain-containing protein [Kiritimatiellia bacterium]HSA19564.1 zinc ribbon domain-containing protein [Kiritimatiellia bacterium]
MPVFEYECKKCGRVSSFLVRNPSAHKPPACPRCGHPETTRVLSRFASVKSGSAGGEGADLSALDGLDENDPRSLGRAMRKMAEETGEPVPPEMEQMMRRLEAGEDPEKLGAEMEGMEGGGPAGDDTLYEG